MVKDVSKVTDVDEEPAEDVLINDELIEGFEGTDDIENEINSLVAGLSNEFIDKVQSVLYKPLNRKNNELERLRSEIQEFYKKLKSIDEEQEYMIVEIKVKSEELEKKDKEIKTKESLIEKLSLTLTKYEEVVPCKCSPSNLTSDKDAGRQSNSEENMIAAGCMETHQSTRTDGQTVLHDAEMDPLEIKVELKEDTLSESSASETTADAEIEPAKATNAPDNLVESQHLAVDTDLPSPPCSREISSSTPSGMPTSPQQSSHGKELDHEEPIQKANEVIKNTFNLITNCPRCESTFKTAFGVRRHLVSKHGVQEKDLKSFKIASTKKRCPFCLYFFGNLAKHNNVCKYNIKNKKTEIVDINMQTVTEYSYDESLGVFMPGGSQLKEKWDEWFETQNLSAHTVRVYTKKLIQLFKFFERDLQGFLVDSLLVPLENDIFFPPLESYLNQATTVGDKVTAIKTYKHLALLVLHLFGKRYGADYISNTSIYSKKKRNLFQKDVESKVVKMTKKITIISRINKPEIEKELGNGKKRTMVHDSLKECAISKHGKVVMLAQLEKDKQFPLSMGQPVLDKACKLNPVFNKMYSNIVKKKGGNKLKANNTLRKALFKKKLK